MQQPPPRKVKHTAVLRKTHSEQLSKLQQKHQHESELLEDIRTFTKERAAIEKHYAQALCKLAQQYLAKRHQFPQTGDSKEGHKKTLNTVWKTVLEETDRVGRSRLQGADSYMQAISEAIKPVKTTKATAAKKVFERTAVIQKEITQSVNEMVRSHKIYHEDEHLSHEARTKALEVDAKLKNKNTGLFTSMSTLQKNSQKLNSRRETCEVKSTSARNEYLLNLAAANAHQIRYYSTDIPNLLQMLDGEMYERIRECFIVFARTELECCGLTQECFTKIMSDAGLISRQFNLDCFLHDNLVFTDLTQYKFEPTDNDEDQAVSSAHQAEEQVQKEARKWATKIAKETNAIRQYNRQLQQLQEEMLGAGKPSDTEKKDEKEKEKDSEKASPEVQIDELQENIRKAETAKMKAEARIDALRMGGVDVDEWLKKAHAESYVEEEEPAPRSSTSMSMKSDSSAEHSSAQRSRNESTAEDHEPVNTSLPNDSTYINYQEEDDIDETFESGTMTATSQQPATTEETAADTNSTGYSSGRNYPMRCMAVYDFQASNSDEVSLTEGENLQIIGDGDGDGWVRALRDDGSSGLVPENYIQFLENGNLPDEYEMNVDGELPVTEEPSYNMAERVSAYSATDYEVQKAMTPEGPQSPTSPPASEGPWVRALYDYEATSEEELSFQEGQFIRIIRKDEDGVDDGWWEGEVNGRVGVFPSLVVEEISGENGGDNLGVVSPVGTGPPPYTPPEPGPLPPQLEITHPTPSDEHAPSEPGRSPGYPSPVYTHWTHYRPRESTV